LRKATIGFVISVCPSVRVEQLGSHWTNFHEIWCLKIFLQYVEKIHEFSWNLTFENFSTVCRENSWFFKKFDVWKFFYNMSRKFTNFHEIWCLKIFLQYVEKIHEFSRNLMFDNFSTICRGNSRIFMKSNVWNFFYNVEKIHEFSWNLMFENFSTICRENLRIFMKFDVWKFFYNMSRKFTNFENSNSLNPKRIECTVHEGQYKFLWYLSQFFLE